VPDEQARTASWKVGGFSSGCGDGTADMKISTILDHIDSGHMALPEFQRGYVWNREQVRGLFDSALSGHPVGGSARLGTNRRRRPITATDRGGR
jgi:hypothetical protein